MSSYNDSKKIKIVFFSGTGSTAYVVNILQKALEAQDKTVLLHELNSRNPIIIDNEDMLIIVYPVHACNAPEAVYEYINAVPAVEKLPVVVLSVSGGGEVTPNNACRLHCIRRLERKGYDVIYERMLVMPSNWMVPTIDGLAIRLLEILPNKIGKILDDLSNGAVRRSKPDFLNRLLSNIGELEKYGAERIGRRIRANGNCTGCGWCEKSCPRANITMINSRPKFGSKCSLCLKCIYGCPNKSLTPGGIGKFVIIKQGYNFNAIRKSSDGIMLESVEKLAKGYLWKGVKDYLLYKDI